MKDYKHECPLIDISLLPLSQGKYAIVDSCDWDDLSQWKWFAGETYSGYRPARNIKIGEKRTILRIHRYITGAPDGMVVDHINHNTLDNRRCNLRVCTSAQNSQNMISGVGVSRYKGVTWNRRDKKWMAQIQYNGKKKNLGYYDYEGDAADAYNKSATKMFGEYALLNQIGD